MIYTEYPVWSFPPNWDSGVLERLEWKTDVLSSETGHEQRVSRRLTPRRSFEASFLIQKENRQYLNSLLTVYGAYPFLIPVWHSVTHLTEPAELGDDTIYLDTEFREYEVGDLIIIRGRSFDDWEVNQVEEITPTSLKLISTLESGWRAGTRVYPARLSRIDPRISNVKRTDQFISMSTLFTVVQKNPYSSGAGDLPIYRSSPVLNFRPDESEDLTHEYERLIAVADNDLGIPDVYDATNLMFQNTAFRWAFKGREKHQQLRQLLYSLRGRAGTVWVPTFMDDFTVVADIAGASTTIDVANVGYSRLEALKEGRKDIRIELYDGTAYYRRIDSAEEISSTVDRLTISSALPGAVAKIAIRSVSFVMRCRLNQDSIEINHSADTDGLTICAVTWRGPAMFEEHTPVWPALPEQSGDCDCGVIPCSPLTAFWAPLTEDKNDTILELAPTVEYNETEDCYISYTDVGGIFINPIGERASWSTAYDPSTAAKTNTSNPDYEGLRITVSVEAQFMITNGDGTGDALRFFSISNGPHQLAFLVRMVDGSLNLSTWHYVDLAPNAEEHPGLADMGTHIYRFIFMEDGETIHFVMDENIIRTVTSGRFGGSIHCDGMAILNGVSQYRFKDVKFYTTVNCTDITDCTCVIAGVTDLPIGSRDNPLVSGEAIYTVNDGDGFTFNGACEPSDTWAIRAGENGFSSVCEAARTAASGYFNSFTYDPNGVGDLRSIRNAHMTISMTDTDTATMELSCERYYGYPGDSGGVGWFETNFTVYIDRS